MISDTCLLTENRCRMLRHVPLIAALGLLAYAFRANPVLTEIASGIAIFLFGMLSLEQGFKAFTGGALERLLRRSTEKLWRSLAFGAVATTLTQSSSLVSVITISFLSAGLMSLGQGIGVIFGANLGTTSGAWLVAGLGLQVDISAYAMPLLTFGVILVFHRSRPAKGLGYILAGVGFLFLGIHFMKEGFTHFQDGIDLIQFSVPGLAGLLLYTLLGMVATVIMQSSHATLVLTITALAAGHVDYDNALALSIGANVGTTVTALIGAVGANIDGRRLAGAHLIFNVTTALIALVFIQGFVLLVELVSGWLGIHEDNHALKLALFHTLFNVTGIVLMVPLIGRMVTLLEAGMKPKPAVLGKPKYINATMLDMPGAALEASRRELLRLFRRVFSLIAQVLNYEPGRLRRLGTVEYLEAPPESVRAVDADDLYLRNIKPLHGLILDFLARLPVQGKRAQQLVMLRVASQQLVEAVKDAKHLQKNLVRYLGSGNPHLRNEYLGLRRNLGYLLSRLDHRAADPEPKDDLELELAELSGRIEQSDVVANGRLDELIRQRSITAEQATSLMNDSAYGYRISKNLLAMARACFLPFEEVDVELREELELDPAEVRAAIAGEDTAAVVRRDEPG
jgi:phosphate:Na+ symporter